MILIINKLPVATHAILVSRANPFLTRSLYPTFSFEDDCHQWLFFDRVVTLGLWNNDAENTDWSVHGNSYLIGHVVGDGAGTPDER